VVNTPDTKLAVVPVMVTPDTIVVNTPEAPLNVTKLAVVPVVVVPVNEV